MKFQSDILMNILFILDTNFIKSDTDLFIGKTFQLRHYTGVKRRHYGVKGVAPKGDIMEERVKSLDQIKNKMFLLSLSVEYCVS